MKLTRRIIKKITKIAISTTIANNKTKKSLNRIMYLIDDKTCTTF